MIRTHAKEFSARNRARQVRLATEDSRTDAANLVTQYDVDRCERHVPGDRGHRCSKLSPRLCISSVEQFQVVGGREWNIQHTGLAPGAQFRVQLRVRGVAAETTSRQPNPRELVQVDDRCIRVWRADLGERDDVDSPA